MKQFPVYDGSNKSGHSHLLAGIMGGLALIVGIYAGSWYGIGAGVLLLGASLFRKYTQVTEDGISVVYDGRIYRYKEEWPFEEISNLHRETGKNPAYVMLHFMKGAMSRRLLFTAADGEQVIQAALLKNPHIHFDEIDG